MTDVIGMDPEEAMALIRAEGRACFLKETRSKKGIEQGRPYVVRSRDTDKGTELTWAYFANEN